MDECAENVNICGINGTCTNTEGWFVCTCRDGFVVDQITGACRGTYLFLIRNLSTHVDLEVSRSFLIKKFLEILARQDEHRLILCGTTEQILVRLKVFSQDKK